MGAGLKHGLSSAADPSRPAPERSLIDMARLSIVVPTLNEADEIESVLASISVLPPDLVHEVIVADGGSKDRTTVIAGAFGARVINCPRSRALQMNAGAGIAKGEYLMFLHADTRLTMAAGEALKDHLRSGVTWGRFDVRLSGSHALLRVVELTMNLRSRWTGIATGDQAMFVRADLFHDIGAFPPIPLMEDIALSRRLKRAAVPACLRERVITSSRKWDRNGVARTIMLMWWLRLQYSLGADPARLAAAYYPSR